MWLRWWPWLWRSVNDGWSSWEQRGGCAGRGREEGRLGRLMKRRRLGGNYLRTKLILLTGGREREREMLNSIF